MDDHDVVQCGVFDMDSSLTSDTCPADFLGIEAHDVSSLLLQFEEASHSSEDSGLGSAPSSQSSQDRDEPVEQDPKSSENSDSPTKAASGKLKAGMKRKRAILLPMGVPSGRVRGSPVTIPAHCSSPKLQKILLKNASPVPSQSRPASPLKGVTNVAKRGVSGPESNRAELSFSSPGEVSVLYYSEISDHDYCQNFPHPKAPPCTEQGEGPEQVPPVVEDAEAILQLTDPAASQFDQQTTDYPEPTESGEASRQKISHKEYRYRRRNYRKHGSEIEHSADKTKFFDKVPSYFTTLSLPTKPPKKDPKSDQNDCGIKVTDFIHREIAPSINSSSDVYNKLPAYHNCFINSTKYDDSSTPTTVSEIEALKLKNTKYPWDKLRDKINRDNPSRSQSPLLLADTRCESKSREISCSPSRSRSVSRSRLPRRYRDSSVSSGSSRSPSSSSSRSPHRSSSNESDRHKRTYRRRERHRERHRRRRERGHSYSSYSSRSSDSEWSSYSRSRSRSYSRSHSRSRSRSPRYRSRPRRDASYERRREERQRLREEEKKRQIEERRIVYVGKIPDTFTRRQLRERFSRFGEIEETSVHFRETGDNYGFVTYAYTCDAYAAIEHGNKVAGDLQFDLCFGGRREFCATDYADLDGQVEEEEELYGLSQKSDVLDFDQMLKDAKRKLLK